MGKKEILITGGAGYIGSHTVNLLHQKGYKLIVVDNLVYGHRESILADDITFIEGDIGDKELMNGIFTDHEIDAVLHFAAYAYVGESVTNPVKYYQNNLAAPLNLLDVMLEHKVNKFIFSSTCATYGNPQYVPLDENHPQQPINPYGTSKYMLEQIIKDYQKAYGLEYVFLRYFNASGAAENGLIGEDHNPETHLIPLILDAALGDREHIIIFGTDYDTEDGSAVRDYIHVDDLADAHAKALQYLNDGRDSVAVNLGTGFGYSVKQVIDAAKEVTGKDIPVKLGERRAGDPPQLVANNSLARDVLGWEAQKADIKEIIASAWKWRSGPRGGKFSE